MPTQKPQEKKTKKFSARTHARSASYGRNLNKLGRITSTEELHQRPGLNRSKSTDGTLGRKNRSFTKLSTLQPLARTRSHQPAQRKGKVVLEFNNDQESSDDENHDGGKKEESEEEVEEFSDEEEASQSNSQPDPAQLRLSYKAPAQFSHTHIPQGSPLSSSTSETTKEPVDSKETEASRALQSALAARTSNLTLKDPNGKQSAESSNQKQSDQSVDQYKESLSEYYQNMILSQSTGAVRAFGDQPFTNSLVQNRTEAPVNEKHTDSLQYIHSNDHISGALGNMKSLASSTNSLRQFTMQNASGESVPNDSASMISAFKGKQASGVSFASNSKMQRESSVGTSQNFNTFLKSNNSNIETRTQQKLWLQRENSLLDLPSASNSNSNSPLLRRDFERVSREYVNARRFFNPSLESVKRVNDKSTDRPHANRRQSVSNPAIIKSVDTNDFQAKIFKLWVDGESGPGNNRRSQQPAMGFQYHQQQQNHHSQQLYHQQRPSAIQTANMSMTGLGNSLRSPGAPTTRAVDRANNSPENKRIDLAAVRMPEEHVQKLS